MATYALMKLGGKTEYDRVVRTLRHLFNTQGESGLFYGMSDEEGNIFHDGCGRPDTQCWALTRKSADVLYFLFKHFDLMEDIPEAFAAGTRKLADRFVRIWEENGQIGQFVNVETGGIIVGGSCSAGIVSAGLTRAWKFFNDGKYLRAARKIADYHKK